MRQHGGRVLSERDRELLRFVAEQYLVTLPQLAFLAGRSERTARWLRTRWQRAGLVDAGKLLVDEPSVIWLTRRGLAALGLDWKTVQPSYGSIPTLAVLVEIRLAAQEQYPHARWLSRRILSHTSPASVPPDGVLTSDHGSAAILAKPRGLPRRELDRQLLPLLGSHDHVLLVVSKVSEHTRKWFDELAGHASVVAHRRDPQRVAPPLLPSLPALEPPTRTDEGWPMPSHVHPRVDFPPSSSGNDVV